MIFNEKNVHKSCKQCNVFWHGNIPEYRKGLIKRYGNEFVEQLESVSDEKRVYKWSREELIAKKLQYEIKIKEFKPKE